MRCLDIVRMIVAPSCAHASRIFVIGHDISNIYEALPAYPARRVLLFDFLLEQSLHFRG